MVVHDALRVFLGKNTWIQISPGKNRLGFMTSVKFWLKDISPVEKKSVSGALGRYVKILEIFQWR